MNAVETGSGDISDAAAVESSEIPRIVARMNQIPSLNIFLEFPRCFGFFEHGLDFLQADMPYKGDRPHKGLSVTLR